MKYKLSILVVTLSLIFNGCKKRDVELAETRNLKAHPTDDLQWIYNGPLPKLERPRLHISLASHTVRVTGLLPQNFDVSQLPSYAKWEEVIDSGKTVVRVYVVYPIATGNFAKMTQNSLGEWVNVSNAEAKTYPKIVVWPYQPKVSDGTHVSDYGGFPYIQYHHTRYIALHGPIDAVSVENGGRQEYEWQLSRGAVSSGCNRMQGEHVVELAHLIGVDMTKPYGAETKFELQVPVTVIQAKDAAGNPVFDEITEAGKFKGMKVDVEFPDHDTSVKHPANFVDDSKVLMFSTWDAKVLTSNVCSYDPERPLGPNHCKGADAKICNLPGGNPVDVFSASGAVIGKANLNEPVNFLPESKDNLQNVFFLTEPRGAAYIDKKYVCRN